MDDHKNPEGTKKMLKHHNPSSGKKAGLYMWGPAFYLYKSMEDREFSPSLASI
jgi:hypothetical protein